MKKLKARINDYVKVIDDGQIYPSYNTMAKRLEATRWINKAYGSGIKETSIAQVVNTCKYKGQEFLLIEMSDTHQQYIISQSGVKIISFFDDNLFEI